MNSFDITTQNINLTDMFETVGNHDEITLHDGGRYGITITATEQGYNVTDETGGDQDVETFKQALNVAADFIENVADEDADWMALAAEIRKY